MALLSNDIQTLEDLYRLVLQDVYHAETQILEALPGMMDKAADRQLREGLRQHLEETRGHVDRLDQVFARIGETPKDVACPAIDGFLREAKDLGIGEGRVRDAALAAAVQAVEHYEIARYGTLIAWSRQLDRMECARLLGETLKEEKQADDELTRIAENHLNAAG
ncbi:ferritin-like domain-containing protein [Oceaniglobus roseus]|uniref:YciE/YciF ferroxidase family protein n=1 Tax=Oceaniglobus roseus TaxID=1737570 RepID=UPI000C7F78DA|nr:DUF892 family protein [Kandeliimicrobium roseum]